MSAMTREKALATLERLEEQESFNPASAMATISAAQVVALVTIADSLDGIADAIEGLTTRIISVEVHET